MTSPIDNWYEGEPVSDVRMNEMVNDLNSLGVGTTGEAVRTTTGVITLPDGITSDTRIRCWWGTCGWDGGLYGIDDTPRYARDGRWGFKTLTGLSAGTELTVTITNDGRDIAISPLGLAASQTGQGNDTESIGTAPMVITGSVTGETYECRPKLAGATAGCVLEW